MTQYIEPILLLIVGLLIEVIVKTFLPADEFERKKILRFFGFFVIAVGLLWGSYELGGRSNRRAPEASEVEVTREVAVVQTVEVTKLVEVTPVVESRGVTSDGELTAGTWKGQLDHGHRTYTVELIIERVDFSNFYGSFNLFELRNTTVGIEGRTNVDFDNPLERSRWAYVEEFDLQSPQLRMLFYYTNVLQGGGIIDTVVLRGIASSDGEIIKGAWFINDNDSSADGNFTLFRE